MNYTDIKLFSNRLVKQNDTTFPVADKTAYANEAMRIIWSWIYEVYGGWIYDDSNNTGLPIATGNLVADQTFYSLPTTGTTLRQVEVADASGNWTKLTPITLETIPGSESEFQDVSGVPIYYRPLANGFKIYPASATSISNGTRIHQDKDISSFTTADTTKTPGFDIQFHEAVPTFMSWRFAEINQLDVKDDLRRNWSNENRNYPLGYEQRIKKYYKQKFNETYPPRFKTRDRVSEYI